MVIVAGCATSEASPGPSPATTSPEATPAATASPTLTPTATTAPATQAPGPTGTLTKNGFRFDDILKIQVNKLAVRVAPTRDARLVHQYLILGTKASDLGEVRLNKGDQVKVQMGPLIIGTTTWYLVWPASGGTLNDQTTNWYDVKPLAGQPVPAWIATTVSGNAYATLDLRPTTAEIAAVEEPGLVVAGTGNYVSPPMPRHDAFQLYWGATTTGTSASCAIKILLVPDDADFDPLDVLATTTTSVKVSPLNGTAELWSHATSATWATFSVEVTTTCRWAIRLIRLEHD
jgi:hypothetical protein